MILHDTQMKMKTSKELNDDSYAHCTDYMHKAIKEHFIYMTKS